MGKYVDGFVLPLPKGNVEAYRAIAVEAGKVWRDLGALAYVECLADDVKVGEVTSFPRSVKLELDETVVFAWILYESREARDRINELAMKDPRLQHMMTPKAMPFDSKRMILGGFETIVEL
jgi:uncharacterized protein YbaA (DUF1428 family)